MGVLDIIKDITLTFEQKLVALAKEAENSIDVLNISDETQNLRDIGIICDLFEGNAPYRPRYILPDYDLFMKKGCEFLRLSPPCDIWEAINNLLILYKHIPSITTMPVFVGSLDYLLEPFIDDEDEAYRAIKFLLIHLDRTITDSFCHGNIGPLDTKAGRIILKVERELFDAVPNLTLKLNKDTPDDYVIEGIKTALKVAKPSFANHEMFVKDLGENYGIASCYNGLTIGGGAFTLVRLVLSKLAPMADDVDDFLRIILPNAVNLMADYMDERIRFIMEESGFFETNFLVKEGFISKDKFTGMFGMVGLAECVNHLLAKLSKRFGHDKEADELGIQIVKKIEDVLNQRNNPYCIVSDGKFLLHAQVGISDDFGVSPGCRIPIGEEPDLKEHIIQAGMFHPYFPSGIGDIFPFDETTSRNPEYILDIIKGAFIHNMRYFSIYEDSADVIRITGYLVKKSDMEKLKNKEQVLHDTVALGLGASESGKILNRRVRNDKG